MSVTICHPNDSIFNSHTCDLLTCPVNTRGVMGRGLALEFSRRFPAHCEVYRDACTSSLITPGDILIVGLGEALDSAHRSPASRPHIVFFATKNDWRGRSEMDWVRRGMAQLVKWLLDPTCPDHSIAIPALGCGLGGLTWEGDNNIHNVGQLITDAMSLLPHITTYIYPPHLKGESNG